MFFELPLALALSCLLSEVPAVHAACFKLPARLCALLGRLIARRHAENAGRLAAYAAVGLIALLAALASLLHPAVRVALLALALPVRALMDEGMRARALLEEGDVRGAAEAIGAGAEARTYEDVVRAACEKISTSAAHVAFAGALLALLGTPLRLGPALACAYAAVLCLWREAPLFLRIRSAVYRAGEWLYAGLCAPLTALCGLEVEAALGMLKTPLEGRLSRVTAAAVGIGQEPTHDPIAGDVVQTALLLWLALGAAVLAVSLALLPLLR